MNNRVDFTSFLASGLLAAGICFTVLSSIVIGFFLPQLMMPITLSMLCSFMLSITHYFWVCYRQTARRQKAGYAVGNHLTISRILFVGMLGVNAYTLYFLLDFYNTLLGFT